VRRLGAASVGAYAHVAGTEKRLAASATVVQPRSYEPPTGFRIRIVPGKGVDGRVRDGMAAPLPIIRGHDLDIAEEQATVAAPLDPNASADAPMSDLTHGTVTIRTSLGG
jgi:hypothetical protein